MSVLTPQQAADALGVSVQTLRRWSAAFGAVLSASAAPGPGRQRSYTVADVAMLAHARDLLAAGQGMAEVAAILPTIHVEDAPPAPPVPMIAESAQERFVSALTVIADQKAAIDRLQADVETLSARLDTLAQAVEATRPPTSWLRRLFGRRQAPP